MNKSNESPENVESFSNPERFPFHALPEPIRQFVDEISRAKSIDPLMVLMPTLAVLSGAIGNARRLQLRSDYIVPAVLWPVVIARSGDGKSPAFHAAMKPIVDLQIEASKHHADRLSAYKAERAEWVKCPKDERESEPVAPSLSHHYLSDSTVEAIALRLAETPRGLLVAVDEFAGLVGAFNQHKGGRGNDLQSWLSFYDASAAKIDRKTSEPPTIFIPRAFVAATGTIQPAILRDILNPSMIQNGFAARLLLAMPQSRKREWINDNPDPAVIARYSEIVRALRSIDFNPDHPKLIEPSDASMNLWSAWIGETEAAKVTADGEAMEAAIPKLADAAARLALIFHLVDSICDVPGIYPDRLDEMSMTRGIECARWFIGEANRIHSRLSETEDEIDRRELIELIRRNGGTITARDLARGRRKYRKAGAAEDALESLVADGLAERVTIKSNGRDATAYKLIE